jgi:acyl-CoA reductase-like NAD-dependent aldehyde dehydrogenase
VRLANDTEYGLASSVYTADIDKATRVAIQIDAGQVGINCYAIENMDVACPWVGHKKSGFGYHSGKEGFHNFSIPKTIVYSGAAPHGDMASP